MEVALREEFRIETVKVRLSRVCFFRALRIESFPRTT